MTGVLAGIEDEAGIELRGAEAFVGTSAGAIVAARLAAGRAPRRRPPAPAAARRAAPEADGAAPACCASAARWGWAATAPLAPCAPARSRRPAARWCARPAVARAGQRAHARPAARRDRALRRALRRAPARVLRRPALGQARRLRCAGRPAGQRGGRGGGVVRDPVGLRPGADRRARVRRRRRVERDEPRRRPRPPRHRGAVPGPDRVAALAPAQAFRVAISVELQVLRRRGAHVRHVGPDDEAAAAMGTDFVATAPAAAALAAGHRQGRALAAG